MTCYFSVLCWRHPPWTISFVSLLGHSPAETGFQRPSHYTSLVYCHGWLPKPSGTMSMSAVKLIGGMYVVNNYHLTSYRSGSPLQWCWGWGWRNTGRRSDPMTERGLFFTFIAPSCYSSDPVELVVTLRFPLFMQPEVSGVAGFHAGNRVSKLLPSVLLILHM